MLEPEVIAPAFTLDECERGKVPEDGQVLHVKYEELRDEIASHA